MAVNPFDYSNKTFLTIYNELKALWSSKPDWFITLMAGRADVLHWYLDARANNLYIDSAFTREAMLNLCKLINYELEPASAATTTVDVTLASGTSLPYAVTKANLIFSTSGSVDVSPIRFEADSSHTFTSLTESVDVTQGETITDEFIGESDGTTEWQEFDLSRTQFLTGSSSITIGVNTWTEITDFLEYDSTDFVYQVISRDDESAFVRFGNGTYGKIPDPNYDINITYRIGGGTVGNVDAGEINVYLGDDTAVESITNTSAASGGAEKESIERARRLAPLSVATQERAVKTTDLSTLAERYAGVARAGVIANAYGLGSAEVQLVPYGGGNPSAALKTNVQNYLIDRSPLESIDIRCVDPGYVTVTVTAQVKILSGYTFAGIQNYVDFAYDMIVSEKTQEVIDEYESDGIGDATTLINSLFGYTFDSDDYTQLEKIIINIEAKDWGDDIYLSDLYAVDAYIDGVDYITISSPVGTITIDTDEIATEGAHVITEIP